MSDDPRVSVFDPATGETKTADLASYIVLTNSARGWEIAGEQHYREHQAASTTEAVAA